MGPRRYSIEWIVPRGLYKETIHIWANIYIINSNNKCLINLQSMALESGLSLAEVPESIPIWGRHWGGGETPRVDKTRLDVMQLAADRDLLLLPAITHC